MSTIVGSRAIHYWFPDFRRGPQSDMDYLAWEGSYIPEFKGLKVDVYQDARLGAWSWRRPTARPDELYTLKISHMFWEINRSSENWNKHAYDAIFLSRKGCKFIPELYGLLFPIWKEKHSRREVNLNQTKQDFFSDNVVRKYDHDSLHRSVMYLDQPMYELVLKDGSEVLCDLDKFQSMPHDMQILLCREEIYVTALERLLIPSDYSHQPRRAYHWALRRTITSLFKNDWALFMALNLDELLIPDIDYLARHRANAHLLEVSQ